MVDIDVDVMLTWGETINPFGLLRCKLMSDPYAVKKGVSHLIELHFAIFEKSGGIPSGSPRRFRIDELALVPGIKLLADVLCRWRWNCRDIRKVRLRKPVHQIG